MFLFVCVHTYIRRGKHILAHACIIYVQKRSAEQHKQMENTFMHIGTEHKQMENTFMHIGTDRHTSSARWIYLMK
jgi:hypothetical protein